MKNKKLFALPALEKPGLFPLFGSLTELMLIIAVIGLLALFAMPAAAAESFGVTNYIAANTTITSYPTNSVTTNQVVINGVTNYANYQTGRKISTHNQRRAIFTAQGFPVTTNSTTVGVTLVRSSASSPAILINTNTGAIVQNDWDTATQLTFSFTVSLTTNAFNWSTNLDETAVGDYEWFGVYQVTNGPTIISNLVFNLNKKILPFTYP